MPYYRLPFYIILGLWQTGHIDAFSIAKFASENQQLINSAIQYAGFIGANAVGPRFDPSLLYKAPFINIGIISEFIGKSNSKEETVINSLIALMPFATAGVLTKTDPASNLTAATLIVAVCQYMSKANTGQMFIFPYYNGYSLKRNEKFATMIMGNIITIVVVRFLKKAIQFYKNLLKKSFKFGWNLGDKARIKISKLIQRKIIRKTQL